MTDALWNAILGFAAAPVLIVVGGVGRLIWRGIRARTSKPPPPPQSVRAATHDPRVTGIGRAAEKTSERVIAAERRIDTLAASIGTLARDVSRLETKMEKMAEDGTRSSEKVQRELGEISGMLARLDGDAE